MDSSSSSLLQESLNLCDVFGSRYSGDMAGQSSAPKPQGPSTKQAKSPSQTRPSESERTDDQYTRGHRSNGNGDKKDDDNDDQNQDKSVRANDVPAAPRRRRDLRSGPSSSSMEQQSHSLKQSQQYRPRPSRTREGPNSPRQQPPLQQHRRHHDNPHPPDRPHAKSRSTKTLVGLHSKSIKSERRLQNHAIEAKQRHDEKQRPRMRRVVSENLRKPVRKDAQGDKTRAPNGTTSLSQRRQGQPYRGDGVNARRYREGEHRGGSTSTFSQGKDGSGSGDSGTRPAPSEEAQFPASPMRQSSNAKEDTFEVNSGSDSDMDDERRHEMQNSLVDSAISRDDDSDSHEDEKKEDGRESDDNENDSSHSDDGDQSTVIQFDPMQADNVFRAKQVSSTVSGGIHMKNKDGTESVFNVTGMQDPLSGAHSAVTGRAFYVAPPPMFDFLGDQPDEEEQEHTESAEREAFDESLRLKEIQLHSPEEVPKQPKGPMPKLRKPPPPTGENRRKKVMHKEPSKKLRPRRSSNEERTSRRAPVRRGVRPSKTMSSVHLPRRGSADSEKRSRHKRMVTDSKNYSQFFKESNTTKEAQKMKIPQSSSKPAVRARPRAIQRSISQTTYEASDSEADAATSRPRRIRKRQPSRTERKPRPSQRNPDSKGSFPVSDTEQLKNESGPSGIKNDCLSFSDTEAFASKRINFSADFAANAFPDAGQTDVEKSTRRDHDLHTDLFGKGSTLDGSLGSSRSFVTGPFKQESVSNCSLEKSSGQLVSEMTATEDTDIPDSPEKSSRKGLGSTIGRYFRKGTRSNGGGGATDTESSDADNMSVASGGSRLFGKRRAKQHQLLGDESFSSVDDSVGFAVPVGSAL